MQHQFKAGQQFATDEYCARPISTTEITSHLALNTLGLIFAIPTAGISLIATLAGSQVYDACKNTTHNLKYGY